VSIVITSLLPGAEFQHPALKRAGRTYRNEMCVLICGTTMRVFITEVANVIMAERQVRIYTKISVKKINKRNRHFNFITINPNPNLGCPISGYIYRLAIPNPCKS